MKISICFLFVILASAYNCLAEVSAKTQNLNRGQLGIYHSTLLSCSEYKKGFWTGEGAFMTEHHKKIFLAAMADVQLTMDKIYDGNFKKALNHYKYTNGLGFYLNDLLHSEGFSLAMNECFPNDLKSELKYVDNLLAVDMLAKFMLTALPAISTLRSLKYFFNLPWIKPITSVALLYHFPTSQQIAIQNSQQSMDQILDAQFKILGID